MKEGLPQTHLSRIVASFKSSLTARPSAQYRFFVFSTRRAFFATTWPTAVRKVTRCVSVSMSSGIFALGS